MKNSNFACPIHKKSLDTNFYCPNCNASFPTINGIPILLNESNSVFRIDDYKSIESTYGGASAYTGHLDNRKGIRQLYRKIMNRIAESSPIQREFTVKDAIEHIHQRLPDAEILIIGSGDTTYPGNVTYTDVALGKNVSCIADAHDLPFENGSFDACIASAVLEHVADPQRCVNEIERILKPSGFVYSETPFMQPVHMGAYDFTRFTYLGHRRLFRRFEEINSGIAGGPATSAAQIIRYLFSTISEDAALRKILNMIGLLITYPLKFIDKITINKLAAYDSASGFYFFGQMSSHIISDRELLTLYKGLN